VLGPFSREAVIYAIGIACVFAVFSILRLDAVVRDWITTAIAALPKNEAGEPIMTLGLSTANFFAVVGGALAIGSIVVLAYLFWFMAAKCDKIVRERMTLALILIAASVVFWTLFEQAGSSLNQFAERNTQLTIWPAETLTFMGLTIDMSFAAAQAQSFNAGFILIFAPVFSALWAFLEKLRRDPNDTLKFSLALIQVGLGFMVLVYGAHFANDDYRVPLIFLALAYLLHTTGELCLSPVGLSMVTKMSAAAVVSTMMAVWFLSSAWAQWLGGLIAQLTATETVAGQVLDPARALATYNSVFQTIGIWSIAIGAGLGVLSFWLNKLAHEEARGGDRGPQEVPAE
jgi:POT family proton-dependent oligopeptide transporter